LSETISRCDRKVHVGGDGGKVNGLACVEPFACFPVHGLIRMEGSKRKVGPGELFVVVEYEPTGIERVGMNLVE
jgi:predicted nucleotide-binding protein (sugar kinase/HSP70/actin superfamily)